jgi:rare lipoprotein A
MTDAVQARPDLPNASPRSSVAVQALPAPGAQTPASPPPAPVLALPAGVVAESAKVAAERQVAALAPVVNTITTVPVVPTEIYVQVGAFQNLNNAVRVSAQLQQVGRVTVEPKTIRGQVLNRVRFGPFTSVEEADQTLARVIAAGYPDARVIVDQ